MKFRLLISISILNLLIGCQKDDNNKVVVKKDFIIIGDSITSSVLSTNNYSIDLNCDSTFDIYFGRKGGVIDNNCKTGYTCWDGMPYTDYYLKIDSRFSSILNDNFTTLKDFKLNDTIRFKDNFTHIDSVYLGRITPNGFDSEWLNSYNHYIGLRSCSSNDTMLYWIKFRLKGTIYSNIIFGKLNK
jgi:hypothetical protein